MTCKFAGHTRVALSSALIIGALALCGCSETQGKAMPPSSTPVMTLTTAKAQTLNGENRIADLIPEQYVVSRRQLENAPVLSCDTVGAETESFMWPGDLFISLQGDPDIPGFIHQVTNQRNDLPEFRARDSKESDGYLGIEIEGEDGSTFYVDFPDAHTKVRIASFSPCFALPEGNSGGTY